MKRTIALITQGIDSGGGVPTVARWLQSSLTDLGGYEVDIHDLAQSSRDSTSRRLTRPTTWGRSSMRTQLSSSPAVWHWGANLVEFEPMRYRHRRELDRCLQEYDLIQVVSGSPALACAVAQTASPVVLQVATTMLWERASRRVEGNAPVRCWRDAMTRSVSRMERAAIRQVDFILVENDKLMTFAQQCGQFAVLKAPPGVDTEFFCPPQSGWDPAGYLLSVCRLSEPRKGLNRLVQAYHHLVEAHPTVPELVLAGRGILPNAVTHLIDNLGLDGRVAVRSDVARSDLPALYRGASVYVQTSYEEGLGISVLEAMASGLPIVATRTAGTLESVAHGLTGYLVPQDREASLPATFATAVLDVLMASGISMSAVSRERCESRFSTHSTIARYLTVYNELLSPGTSQGL